MRVDRAVDPLRIAIIVGLLPNKKGGGTERQAMRTAIELAARGHCVWLLARGDAASSYRHDGVWIAERPDLRLSGTPYTRLPVSRFACDVAHGLKDIFRSGQRFDVVLSYHTFDAGVLGTAASIATGVPLVLWIRSSSEYRADRLMKRHLLAPTAWLLAHTLLVQSPTLASEFERAIATTLPRRWAARINRKLRVLSNGLDIPADTGLPPSGRELLVVGRLDPGKGVNYLIESLRLLPGTRLTVVGDGEERTFLEALARGLPVAFVGPVPHSELGAYYKRASAVVFPSTLAEGLPNVVLEAMAYARPVVASRVGGVADLVHDGINGVLVQPANTDSLASGIRALFHSPDGLVRMSAAARETAKTYAWDALLPRLEAVLAESAHSRQHRACASH